MKDQQEQDEFNQAREIWDTNASFWDDYMGEGNSFQKTLIGPTTERLLELRAGETVLDIACGNGNFSRRLAQLGAQVVAFDFSEVFIGRAQTRTMEKLSPENAVRQGTAARIEYRVIDATDYQQLLSLGERRFDAAVSTMALMDMSELEPLLSALSLLLKPGGRFIFSIMHPCFNFVENPKIVEEQYQDGKLVTRYAVKVMSYIQPVACKGLGIIGQPVPHIYFHRPLSLLLNQCFQAGFVLDRFEEPTFEKNAQGDRPFSWENLPDIPPVLVARMRSATKFATG